MFAVPGCWQWDCQTVSAPWCVQLLVQWMLELLQVNMMLQKHLIIIAVFSNMRTLKFKAQLTIGFFAAVNHNYGDSQQTLKHRNKQNGSKSTNHDQKK